MSKTAVLGFPRIGEKRELKKALESYWAGKSDLHNLESVAKTIREQNFNRLKKITYIPSCDFSYYDLMLDMSFELGIVPQRHKDTGLNGLDLYFAIARGYQKNGKDVVASEMTKWFDTNYHYIVPEFESTTNPEYKPFKFVKLFKEARELEYKTRPVIIGPVTYIALSKSHDSEIDRFKFFDTLIQSYKNLIQDLINAGATDIQIDEPLLTLDLDDNIKSLYKKAFGEILRLDCNFHLATYFESIKENFDLIKDYKFASIHIDKTRGGEALDYVLSNIKDGVKLSLGVVDGRNIWVNNYETSLASIHKATAKLGADRVIVASSCSLTHSPVTLRFEKEIEDEIKEFLAFAEEKIVEILEIADISSGIKGSDALALNKQILANRKHSKAVHNHSVQDRVKGLDGHYERLSIFEKRIAKQQQTLNLPLYPTTTIGSFPQTADVRKARNDFKSGKMSLESYNTFIKEQIDSCIKFQEEIDIDVLVHGEFERNDMVEYFGEELGGFIFTENGWVQSYGSRCVKPPVIFGDVYRKNPITVEWSSYAKSQTKKVMKGMLTGPVTILQWSFVRNDLSRELVCKQIALALQDEVLDLEKAGIKVIQIDEPAIREGLPLKSLKKADYLKWAVDCFKISAYKVADDTQIHTHMCYSEFNDIIKSVADMDADVISIETSRSNMDLLEAFVDFNYPNAIGPGLYDIHSPRVPNKNEMLKLLEKAAKVIKKENLWVNPDCGLKTRGWSETKDALIEMVATAKQMRG
jgi:5-methyltetrahydropteroyltriglutamate--homocysteine methyltransferase